jgi:hypothetical protein
MNHINDRISFDNLFKRLLSENYSHIEAKDYILNHYSLSAYVFQDRIENSFYRKIKINQVSEDLVELRNKIYKEIIVAKNYHI